MVAPARSEKDQRLRLDFGVVGKRLFRIRELHVANHLVPLISRRAVATAKLDLVLRCVALSPQHAGKREPGLVLPQCSWELLHDLARGDQGLGSVGPGIDPSPQALKLKRKWVGHELKRLEAMKLVRRELRPGNRPRLFILRDDGSGEPFDDPDGSQGNTYISIRGGVIGSRTLALWGAPELSAFLAAMAAERSENYDGRRIEPGTGRWYRPLAWFADKDGLYGPSDRVRLSFSVPTLERGISKLEAEKLIGRRRILRNPRTNRRLKGPRNLYFNNFDALDEKVEPPKRGKVTELEEGLIEF
ncbi:MAG TPA: hypothetical protein VG816_01915 [Solirubrobacterales bacterium]|nr:hypothetical protein [Solirubrobacterales bacterium]